MAQPIVLELADDRKQQRRMTPPLRTGLPDQFETLRRLQRAQFGAMGEHGSGDAFTAQRMPVDIHVRASSKQSLEAPYPFTAPAVSPLTR